MPLWKVWAIIRNLRPESALHRKVNPDQWRAEHYILADLFDLLAVGNGVVQQGTKNPVKYERPHERADRLKREQRRDQILRESRDRFRRQLQAGGDF